MKWGLLSGWLLAVAVTTAVAWQIVAIADSQIGEAPVSPVSAALPSTEAGAGTTIVPSSTTAPGTDTPTTSTTTASSSPTTTASSSPTTTASSSPTTTGTSPTTSSPGTSTTTASDDPWSTKTTVTTGGTVVVSYRPGEVVLETVIPLAGFQVEIDKAGPPEVEVEFESAAVRVEFDAEWKDGALHIEVDEN